MNYRSCIFALFLSVVFLSSMAQNAASQEADSSQRNDSQQSGLSETKPDGSILDSSDSGEETSPTGEFSGGLRSSRNEVDTLFNKLAAAPDKQDAERIAKEINKVWLDSDSDTIILLMSRAANAMSVGNYPLAMDFLDAVVRFKPNYAEGWNRRATVLYLQGEFDLSIRDIEQTLALEPRHWGALSGLASIMKILDEPENALEAYERILEIYPHLESAQKGKSEIEQDLLGKKL